MSISVKFKDELNITQFFLGHFIHASIWYSKNLDSMQLSYSKIKKKEECPRHNFQHIP